MTEKFLFLVILGLVLSHIKYTKKSKVIKYSKKIITTNTEVEHTVTY